MTAHAHLVHDLAWAIVLILVVVSSRRWPSLTQTERQRATRVMAVSADQPDLIDHAVKSAVILHGAATPDSYSASMEIAPDVVISVLRHAVSDLSLPPGRNTPADVADFIRGTRS